MKTKNTNMNNTNTMKIHKHKPATESIRCFTAPVAYPENPAAHGNICISQTCSCGATRRINKNGRHIERGPWIQDDVA